MSIENEKLVSYLAAVRALQSDAPEVRRPAISMLLKLAKQDRGSVQVHAERALTEEFGPYALTDGISGCSAPIEAVNACDGNCRSCVWLWEDRPRHPIQHRSVVAPDSAPVGETYRASSALQSSRFRQCRAEAVRWCIHLNEYLRWVTAVWKIGTGYGSNIFWKTEMSRRMAIRMTDYRPLTKSAKAPPGRAR